MFEVRQGVESSIQQYPWRYSTGPVCRFQAVDHPLNRSQNGTVSCSSNRKDLETRIDRLCSSLQSILESSRQKERWTKKVKGTSVHTDSRRYFPSTQEWGISEADLYIDSGGNVHGPLDLKHSSKLDGMKKSSDSFIKRSWMEGQRSQSSTRSEANYHTFDGHRSRTFSESKGHVSAEIDGLLDDLNRMRHRENLNNRMTRWSSLGTIRGDGGRYSTTLTRRHMKRSREPIDVYLNKPSTSNLTKVDILSVDNRTSRRGSLSADREQRLMDELIETRKELQRTRSMISEDGKRGLNYGSTLKVPVSNIRIPGAPPRTYSQTNIHQYSNTLRNQWSSENNLHVGSYLKQAPIRGTYSAHQENLRRRNELNQHSEHLRSSRRMSETGYGEICQEIVSLLPIGRGIQDLESGSNAATLPRAGSQTAGRSYSAGVGNRGQYYSGTQSPALSRQHGGRVVSEHRSRTVQNESHWSNYNGLGSSTGSLHGGSYTAGQGQTNHMALDTIDSRHMLSSDMSFHWFRPNATRQEATQMLINKEPGRFIIRTSKSQPDCYALVVRVPITADDSEPVRTFLLNRVKGGDAVHLRGFESEPIFPSLSAFVHDHTIHQGVLPVLLKVPMRSALSSSYLAGGTASPSVGRYSTAGTDFSTDVLYLGSVDVFPLQGESAVKRAVEQVLSQANNPLKGLKKKCEATVMCSINKGITIVDKNSTRFTKKSIPANKILYCSYDPDERVFNAIELKNRGVADSQIFAIVVKKTRFTMTEHAVYVMCQLEPHQPSSSLINFINQNLPVHYR
ncbi:unnamed protein product [Hymenolepis diminuta]|uniref:SH2 domain-containing protein n=1 Tax=Hymenolepis diminuta TaxID=6216 RepID=A0A564Y0I4_HYMDI|nr:unnamed protein product [Hymenolepis diminuta]